jgi:hypothetical protein
LKGRNIYFAHGSEVSVHHGRETVAEQFTSWCPDVQRRKERKRGGEGKEGEKKGGGERQRGKGSRRDGCLHFPLLY